MLDMIDFGDFGQPVVHTDWDNTEIYCKKCGIKLYTWMDDYGKFTDPNKPVKVFEVCCIGGSKDVKATVVWAKNPYLGIENEERHINKYVVKFGPLVQSDTEHVSTKHNAGVRVPHGS